MQALVDKRGCILRMQAAVHTSGTYKVPDSHSVAGTGGKGPHRERAGDGPGPSRQAQSSRLTSRLFLRRFMPRVVVQIEADVEAQQIVGGASRMPQSDRSGE